MSDVLSLLGNNAGINIDIDIEISKIPLLWRLAYTKDHALIKNGTDFKIRKNVDIGKKEIYPSCFNLKEEVGEESVSLFETDGSRNSIICILRQHFYNYPTLSRWKKSDLKKNQSLSNVKYTYANTTDFSIPIKISKEKLKRYILIHPDNFNIFKSIRFEKTKRDKIKINCDECICIHEGEHWDLFLPKDNASMNNAKNFLSNVFEIS